MASSDVSAVSNETSILSSLDTLLPNTAYRVLVGSLLLFAPLLFSLRRMALRKTMDELHSVMCDIEWVYYQSMEAGLLDGGDSKTLHEELRLLQTKASELREQGLRASTSTWRGVCAVCRGLSLNIMNCDRDAQRLKTQIEIAREVALRNSDRKGQAHFLPTIRSVPMVQFICTA
ncbi:hypothetical protein C8F04DRAFT_1401807 [Mycena alexandri]|uniref:Uncharacterized protein n=1 Tax=Mycena alexandri TaxID=1745969 RepID=A0AAD6WW13_9AGAR|nr:hypothetical protein C8F04DRAFT_1401807 [Mycena alexandri]